MTTSPALEPQPSPTTVGASVFADLSADSFRDSPLWVVGDVVGQVVDLYTHGRIEREDAELALQALTVVESDGTRWAMGATTRRWFKKLPGGSWKPATAPGSPASLEVPARDALHAGLWALGVDPATVSQVPTQSSPAASDVDDLIDDLIGGYGDG